MSAGKGDDYRPVGENFRKSKLWDRVGPDKKVVEPDTPSRVINLDGILDDLDNLTSEEFISLLPDVDENTPYFDI